MSDRFERMADLFAAARELPESERARLLESKCGGDAALRADVERLLRHDSSGPLDCFEPLAELRPTRPLPERVGPFRVLGEIGEGGMGVVYEAEQDSPRRAVAVKVIRPGFAHGPMLQRFQREVKALGRLEHPGIARIYEAGFADLGHGPQPYFAMERVHGASLLKSSNQRGLDARGRVQLLAAIADAVQHAHERGVVHRDLKPGNVLVTADGQPKVLDFGVARLVDAGGAQTTLATGEGQILGTLQYMSPEQVSGTAGAVDARSDVYSLGLIGFELLSGRLPYEIGDAPIAQAARVIQEQDPTSLGLVDRRLAGDLDTILAKALEKDPRRRYASAAALAADLRRYLADEPITARPASMWYQVTKFARRNRGLVAGILIAFAVLVAGTVGVTVFAFREQRHRIAAVASAEKAVAVQNLWLDTLAWADPYKTQGRALTVIAALDAASARLADGLAQQPETEAAFRHALGVAFWRLGAGEPAVAQLARAVELRRGGAGDRAELIDSLHELGRAELLHSDFAAATATLRAARDIARDCFGPDRPRAWEIETDRARALRAGGHSEESLAAAEEAVAALVRTSGPTSDAAAYAYMTLAEIQGQRGAYPAAEDAARRAIEALASRSERSSDSAAHARLVLADALGSQGKHAEAESLYREVLAEFSDVLGLEHPNTLTARMNVAINLARQGRVDDASREFVAIHESQVKRNGADAFETLLTTANAIGVHVERGRPVDALALADDLAQRAARALAASDWHRAYFEFLCGLVWIDAGRVDDGRRLLSGALPLLERQFGADAEIPRRIRDALAELEAK